MRPLHVIARDLSDIAEMQQALATDLLELSVFFGGALPAAAPPAKASQPSPPLPQPPPRPTPPPAPPQPAATPQVHLPHPSTVPNGATEEGTESFTRQDGRTVVRRKANKEPSRHLSPEEKANIKRDWLSLPESLRTPTNRAAIAAKYRCSRAQVFALTRTDLHEHLKAAQAAKARKYEERQAARQS